MRQWHIIIPVLLLVPFSSEGADIHGRLLGTLGDGVHESLVWAVGQGTNAGTAQGSALSWTGDYRIRDLDPGTYHMVANEFGGHRHLFLYGVQLPGPGDLNLNLRHTGAMATPGFTGLDFISECGQTFVATGPYLWKVTALAATGGVDVEMTVHRGGPGGPQLGPSRTQSMGTAFPTFFSWKRGEVPLDPGETYYLRMVRTDGPRWLPLTAIERDPFPRGHAWFEGQPTPNYDLNLGVECIDDGHIYTVKVSSGFRTDRQHEVGQTFKANGKEIRFAAFMLGTSGDSFLMRLSVHDAPGGAQIGPAKLRQMGANIPGGVVWGPGEVPTVPGQTYYLKLTRADGGNFSIYGTDNNYPDGQLYLDGVPVNADASLTVISKEVDLPSIAISNVLITDVTETRARIAWTTDVASNSWVEIGEGDPVFPHVQGFSAANTLAHSVALDGLRPGVDYNVRVWSWRDGYNPASSGIVTFQTTQTSGTLGGVVRSAGSGSVLAGARIVLEPGDYRAVSAAGGSYLIAAPPGNYTLTAKAFGYTDRTVTPVTINTGAHTPLDLTLDGRANAIVNGGFESGLDHWTSYGRFDAAMDSGTFSVPAHSGNKWAGSVSNFGAKIGGIRQTVSVDPSRVYDLRGYIFSEAFKDNGVKRQDGLAQGRIGFDPSGGTDPVAQTVVWGPWTFTAKQWEEANLTASAPSGLLTVFCETRHESWWDIPQWFKVGFDDISLTVSTAATTGTIAGQVTASRDGQPLEGAVVRIDGTGRTATTSADGRYTHPGIDPGVYSVTASKPGYDSMTRTSVAVTAGETTNADFTLAGEGLPIYLDNPSFELGDLTGWTWIPAESGQPDGVWGPEPWYAGIVPQHLNKALMVATRFGYKAGTIHQRVGAIKGETYRASCWIRTYQLGGSDFEVAARIGISPNGGTDPTSGIAWGDRVSSPGQWTQITVDNVTVIGTEVTVFCEIFMSWPREWQLVAIDNFTLEPVNGFPTPTPTPVPTPTPAPSVRSWIQVY